ncbi:amino acid racemase [Acinetobacter towneri]|uniref:aspartate/glutamate racemase family protein n=1 Tax=Acinetobacter towneri TaxID=202956 RepID=UPI003A87644F
MPRIEPKNTPQVWSENEKTLGVIGMSPFATLNFLNMFYSLIHAEKEWQYPRVLLDINTKIPSRGRFFELGEEDPSPYIAQTIAELYQQGADYVLIPCNTVHILQEDWGRDSPIPIISIIDVVKEEALKNTNVITTLGTKTITSKRVYSIPLEKAGVNVRDINQQEQSIISAVIEEVKQKGQLIHNQDELGSLLATLKREGVGTVILGCTELSCITEFIKQHGINFIDSNSVLAQKAVNLIMGR